jgi:outer membrane protein OmpA-like peptidoglycan-associated protein
MLAACGPSLSPLEWARVAAGRVPTDELPPVPGADRPYPNLGAVPQRPVPPSPEQRRRIADALVADRENARHVGPPAMPAPVGVTSPVAPSPSPLTAQPATPLGALDGGADVPGMVAPLAAPRASPPLPIAGAPRPAGPVPPPGQSPPPFQPARAPQAAQPAPAAPALAPDSAAPPPRSDPSVIVDRSALPPPRPASTVTLPAGQGAALDFPPGSATLLAEARAVVARFAAGLGGATVRVTGYRDSAGGDLGLALARAQAVAQALRAAGLPAEAIELAADPRPGPAGRGAEMRLVYSP